MESDCTLRFGFNALIKSISYSKQSNLFLHFLSTSKRFSSAGPGALSRACSYSVWQWRRIVVYVLLHDHVNVRVCNLHNPHHTGNIETRKQHTVCKSRPELVGFTYTFVSICGDRFSNWILRNGSIPLHSVSIVNFTEEWALLSVSKKLDAVSILRMMVSVSSTYLR